VKNHWLAQAAKKKDLQTLNSRFLKLGELKLNPKLLEGIDRKWSRQVTAELLQSHRLRNEGGCWCG